MPWYWNKALWNDRSWQVFHYPNATHGTASPDCRGGGGLKGAVRPSQTCRVWVILKSLTLQQNFWVPTEVFHDPIDYPSWVPQVMGPIYGHWLPLMVMPVPATITCFLCRYARLVSPTTRVTTGPGKGTRVCSLDSVNPSVFKKKAEVHIMACWSKKLDDMRSSGGTDDTWPTLQPPPLERRPSTQSTPNTRLDAISSLASRCENGPKNGPESWMVMALPALAHCHHEGAIMSEPALRLYHIGTVWSYGL